ncbi:MAG TPA: UMP kinase [Synergistaceae bacterium]|jgi:uridylate kinase|nr:MAG: Uridylate kinase [Synergistales bacterium 57_84]KUK88445.1 MAG: Uridylate kinase [Synergistales bacterium 58_81]HAK41173.1 UMP kinase [Synergistaceae bacterium]HPA58687.1 UMP kinase [Synergistales bacterium]HBG14999.1 UMP kinase [Synergistaceae bacterium]
MASYHRILLKLSGEVLAGDSSFGLDMSAISKICREIASLTENGLEIAMVVGGGNIFRGAQSGEGYLDRAQGDYMGMLATVINSLALQSVLERLGVPTRVQTAIEMRELAEPFIRRKALRHLEKGRIVIFAAGTGSPFFSTDTAAALRAAEISADCLLKATKVDGIYDKDPADNPDARLLPRITYVEALQKQLKVMDAAAFSLCMENRIPILVANILKEGTLRDILIRGKQVGTIVHFEKE